MPFDKDQIDQKLAQLEGYVAQMKLYGQKPQSEFTENSIVEAAVERLVIEEV